MLKSPNIKALDGAAGILLQQNNSDSHQESKKSFESLTSNLSMCKQFVVDD